MPAIPNSENNFILGLSDFWTRLFAEAPALAVMYDAMQLEVGQSYLDLLSDVLSISLKDVPLFSKRYFQYVPIREDQLRFVEGASVSDDRWVFSGDLTFAQLQTLMNRVIAPTVMLEDKLDYDVVEGSLQFKQDIFNTDGQGNALQGIPQRSLQVQFPYDFFDITVSDWTIIGALPGDIFRVKFSHGLIVETGIALVRNRLVLTGGGQNLATDPRRSGYTVDVLRTPYNSFQTGEVVPNVPTIFTQRVGVGGVFDNTNRYIQTTLDVDFTQTDGSGHSLYLNKYLYLNDPVFDENNGVFRIQGIVDAHTVSIDRPAPFHNPPVSAWTSGTSYAKRDRVSNGGNTYYALQAHTSSGSFTADLTAGDWALYVLDLIVLDYSYSVPTPPAIPTSQLVHGFLIDGSVILSARRIFDKRVGDIVYPSGGMLIEGIDYVVGLETGLLFHLSVWDSTTVIRAEYDWRLPIYHRDVSPPPPWQSGHFYYVNDTVVLPDGSYWYAVSPGLSSAQFLSDQTNWRPEPAPFGVNPVYSARELAFWAPDVSVDEQRLFENFGYLLAGRPAPSTESYRAFLSGVMQLFVLGPAVQRLESALNVMGGLPVVRDDGEVLQAFDNGIIAQANDGQLIDGQLIRDGNFDIDGHFVDPDGNFFASDLLATVTITHAANPHNDGTYVVQQVNGPGDVILTPSPITAEIDTGFVWRYSHVAVTRQFSSSSYLFTDSDIGGFIVIENASNAVNVGTFKILARVNPHSVLLEAPDGFLDEVGISWKLTHRNTQIVTTDRTTYEYPFLIPMRKDLSKAPNIGTLTFKSFEPLATAFQVVDYLVDPTWFHNLSIPPELLQLVGDEGGRRQVATTLIANVVNALDGAVSGDPGLIVGADDEGRVPPARKAALSWTAPTNVVALAEPIGVHDDIGQYLSISTTAAPLWEPGTVYVLDDEVVYLGQEYYCSTAHTSASTFNPANWTISVRQSAQGSFKILSVSNDGLRFTLERFPTPEMAFATPGTTYRIPAHDIDLPPFVYRRTVGFVIMDRFLKYHSFRVRINTRSDLNTVLISQLSALLADTKPSHTYIFVDPATLFQEHISLADSIMLNVGVLFSENITDVDNDILSGTIMESGDAYSYITSTTAGAFAGGAEMITFTPVIPVWVIPPYRTVFCFARFTAGHSTDGTRICKEGIDYTIDYNTGVVSVVNGLAADAYSISWVCVVLRNVAMPDHSNGELEIVSGGQDPTIIRPGAMIPATQVGILDRPITLTIGP